MTLAENRESEVRARERESYLRELAVEHDMRIIACGGAGCNVGEYIVGKMPHVPITYLNSDESSLKRAKSGKVVQVGRDVTYGRSALYPEVGEACAARCEKEIREALEGADMAIVVAGLGGGVGSGAAPYVASVANEMGIATFGIVVLPFVAERGRRSVAIDALAKMKERTSLTVAIDNEMLTRVKDVSMDQAFHVVNEGALRIVQNFEENLKKEFMREELNEMERADASGAGVSFGVSDSGRGGAQRGETPVAPGTR